MLDKKLRTILILVSIMISSALFFATNGFSTTMASLYQEGMKKYFGSAEIMVTTEENASSLFFNPHLIEGYDREMEYIIGTTEGVGYYRPNSSETIKIGLLGIQFDDLQIMNPVRLDKIYQLLPFEGRKMIIGQQMAMEYGLVEGADIEIELNGVRQRFIIAGIAHPQGPFREDNSIHYAVVPLNTLSSLSLHRGKVTSIYMKPKVKEEVEGLISALQQEYPRLKVAETISGEQLKDAAKNFTEPLIINLIIVFLICIFIIYTSFKVIILERIQTIGTLRSIGATKLKTTLILLGEAILYGVLGGLLGWILGLGIMYIMTYIAVGSNGTQGIPLNYRYSHLITSLMMAIGVSLISSILPILKISKLTIKEIMFGSIEAKSKKKKYRIYLGSIQILFILFILPITPRSFIMPISILSCIMAVAAIVLLAPYFTSFFMGLFEKANKVVFGNVGVIAAKNVRENSSVINNSVLLAIGLSSLLVINTLSASVVKEVTGFFTNTASFDIMFDAQGMDRNLENSIKRIPGVASTYGIYQTKNIELEGLGGKISLLQGIDKNKLLDYWSFQFQGNEKEMLQLVEGGRYIILATAIKDKYQLKVGDTIRLKLPRSSQDYIIAGFVDTLLQVGSYGMISDRYFKLDTGITHYGDMYIKTNDDPQRVANSLKKHFSKISPVILTMDEVEEMDQNLNRQLFAVLRIFSLLTMLIGVFGVLNNYIISFLQRKRSFAIYRSIGMSKVQMIQMILVESIIGGMIGGVMGVLGGVLTLYAIPYFMKGINAPIPITYSKSLMLYSILAGLCITLIASISPVLKSSKLNIIETIKFE